MGPAPRRYKWVLALVGLGLGGGAAALAGLEVWQVLVFSGLTAAIGFLLGVTLDLRGQLVRHRGDLARLDEALQSAALANERRTAELSQTRDELGETLARVQALSESQSRFFANLSHDLRTPLTLIMGPLEDLSQGREPPGGRDRALLQMRRNGLRVQQLIDQILLLARFDAGAIKMVKRRTDPVLLGHTSTDAEAPLALVVDDAAELHNPLNALLSAVELLPRRLPDDRHERVDGLLEVMEEASRRIHTLTEDLLGLSGVQKGDYEPFKPAAPLEAALRLFENAVRAVEGGGTIRVRSGKSQGDYLFCVEDDGPGVDTEVEERIFAPFFTTRAAGQGTGLGLSIARRVVQEHGGRIEVGRSSLGGARFTVRVPLSAQPG